MPVKPGKPGTLKTRVVGKAAPCSWPLTNGLLQKAVQTLRGAASVLATPAS